MEVSYLKATALLLKIGTLPRFTTVLPSRRHLTPTTAAKAKFKFLSLSFDDHRSASRGTEKGEKVRNCRFETGYAKTEEREKSFPLMLSSTSLVWDASAAFFGHSRSYSEDKNRPSVDSSSRSLSQHKFRRASETESSPIQSIPDPKSG